MTSKYVIPPSDRFPLKAVFLASLLPALLGLCCALFVIIPGIAHDTAFGLAAWANYTNGGTWNTVTRVAPENIANTIEVAVTWWPPGQYLPIALLSSSGLSLGTAALLVTFFSTLSLGIGGAFLIRELGGEDRILPWASAALGCSYYALLNFNQFIEGEIALMAMFPWIMLFAWKCRNRTALLVPILPVLFLFGSFIKHSFTIQSICIIIHLKTEERNYAASFADYSKNE